MEDLLGVKVKHEDNVCLLLDVGNIDSTQQHYVWNTDIQSCLKTRL